mmetsp:Transcript_1004/g.4289  ORF Transcript_1004/g.4289 Transcript_1004/m.4289 type:complete len:206 (-) Transcript_1004:993-1610(-)
MLAPHYAGALFDALAENEEQVRLRRMLRHGRAKRLSDAMQSLIDTSEPVIITTVPPTLCVLAANTPMLNVLGAKGSDIIGSDVRELFHADPAFDSLIIAAGNTRHKEVCTCVLVAYPHRSKKLQRHADWLIFGNAHFQGGRLRLPSLRRGWSCRGPSGHATAAECQDAATPGTVCVSFGVAHHGAGLAIQGRTRRLGRQRARGHA